MSKDVTPEIQSTEVSQDDSVNGVREDAPIKNKSDVGNTTFEQLLQEISQELNSGKTSFGKVFRISEIVSPEVIQNIPIPNLELVPTDVDGIG